MATKYGTAREVEDASRQMEHFDSIQNDPYKWGSISDKAEFRKARDRVKHLKESITPPPVTVVERDNLMRRQEILASFIRNPDPTINKPGMPSRKEQWDAPAGAVGKHRKYEHAIKKYTVGPDGKAVLAKDGYGAESEWKDNQRRLYGEDQYFDPDVSNLEILRSQDPVSKIALADVPKMSFAQGASITDEQWNETVGPRPAPVNPPAAVQAAKPKKPPKVIPVELQCGRIRKNGTPCPHKKMRGKERCFFCRNLA